MMDKVKMNTMTENNNANLTSESSSPAVVADVLERLKAKSQSDEILDFFLDEENSKLLEDQCLELLDFVGDRMNQVQSTDIDNDEDKDAWDNYGTIVSYIARRCSPKEVLICLLHMLELVKCRQFFVIVLRSLHVTFVRLPGRNPYTLSETVVSIYRYLVTLRPDSVIAQLDDGELPLVDDCQFLIDCQTCVQAAVDFCQPLISETKECKLMKSEALRCEQRHILTMFLMKLLEHPVAYFCLSNDDRLSSRFQTAATVVESLRSICGGGTGGGTILSLVDAFEGGPQKLESASLERTYTVDGGTLGILAALVLYHGISPSFLTYVHSHQFLFESLLPFITRLWAEHQDEQVMRHGLHVAEHFVNVLGVKFNSGCLNSRRYQEFWLNIIHPMTCSLSDTLRPRCAKLFCSCLEQFPVADQMTVIRLIFSATDCRSDGEYVGCPQHSSVRGLLIDYFRKQLTMELRSTSRQSGNFGLCQFFREAAHLFTYLPNQEKTDLIFYYDQCSAALNFLRFVAITSSSLLDGERQHVLQEARHSFFKLLTKGIELAQAHYNLHLKTAKGTTDSNDYRDRLSVQAVQSCVAKLNLLRWLVADVNNVF